VAIPIESLGAEDIYCAGPSCATPNTALDGPGYSLEVLVILTPYYDVPNDIAPNIDWSFHVANDTADALSLSFIFFQDITATPAPGVVNTSYRAGTTNGGESPGPVTIQQLPAPGGIPTDGDAFNEIHVSNLSVNGGTTLVNMGLDLGQTFNSNPALTSDTYPAENSPLIAGPLGAGSYNFMRTDVNLSVTNGGDEANAFGTSRVNVPEPQAAALVGLGLVALGYAGRRRHA
jgi:hypothetical protein